MSKGTLKETRKFPMDDDEKIVCSTYRDSPPLISRKVKISKGRYVHKLYVVSLKEKYGGPRIARIQTVWFHYIAVNFLVSKYSILK